MSKPDEASEPQVKRDVFAQPMDTSQDFLAEVYRYRDGDLRVIHQTSVPKDDEAALAYFHTICLFGPAYRPVYVEHRTSAWNEAEVFETLPYMFDLDKMSVVDF